MICLPALYSSDICNEYDEVLYLAFKKNLGLLCIPLSHLNAFVNLLSDITSGYCDGINSGK